MDILLYISIKFMLLIILTAIFYPIIGIVEKHNLVKEYGKETAEEILKRW